MGIILYHKLLPKRHVVKREEGFGDIRRRADPESGLESETEAQRPKDVAQDKGMVMNWSGHAYPLRTVLERMRPMGLHGKGP